MLIKICLVTFNEEILNGKRHFLCSELIFSQWLWDEWLFISAFFWKQFLRVQIDWKTSECLFGMNLSLLYWFIWNKNFKWFIKSISNILKRKQINFFHWLTDWQTQTDRQTDRQTAFFSHDFLFKFFFLYHGEKKRFWKREYC